MHKHAKILNALAEGRAVEWRNPRLHDTWQRLTGDEVEVLQCLCQESGYFEYRVKPVKRKGWINIYDRGDRGFVYETQERARKEASRLQTVIARIEIEYEEGQGL